MPIERKRARGRPPHTDENAKRASFNTRLRSALKLSLEAAASREGRSLSEEIEFRLERSLEEERHLVDALELGFGRQVAGVMLAIGHVMKVTERPDWLFDNFEAFRVTVNAINLLLAVIDPGGDPGAWARLRQAFDDPVGDPEMFASVVAGAIVDPEQEEYADLGPLIPIIRNWLGTVLIARLRQRLGIGSPDSAILK
jgi:hypothetical protein